MHIDHKSLCAGSIYCGNFFLSQCFFFNIISFCIIRSNGPAYGPSRNL
nr:ZIP [Expression vector pDrive-ZIP SVPUAT]